MKQKVGLIIDSISVSKQTKDLIELSLTSENYEISTLIINDFGDSFRNKISRLFIYFKKKGFNKFVSTIFFRLVCKIEKKIIERKKIYKDFYKKYNLNEREFKLIRVSPIISKKGHVFEYSKKDLKKIKDEGLNLLIRNGSGILKGEILKICPNGIISFHHADNKKIRGGPAGFWEVYNEFPKTGFIIQRLKDELDGGEVLYKGFIQTQWFYSLNLVTLYEKCNPFFHKILENLTSKESTTIIHPSVPYSSKIFSIPKIHQTFFYIYKTSKIFFVKKIRKIFRREKRWGIAYQYSQNWKDIALWRSKKISNPKNRYLADPFLIFKNDKHYCFVEDFSYAEKKGCISVYEISHDGYQELGVALKQDFHLSFPYIFEFDGELFMCPETNQKNEIRLYKCLDFPLNWQFYKTIMKNVSAADTQIFFFDNKWWLFTNIDESQIEEHSSQLQIFHSESPLSNHWIPLKNNPIIFDSSKARNGGLIKDDHGIYRVYQKQGFDQYGKAFGVAKILSLDTKNYIEESLFEVQPNFFSNITATHTFNYVNGLAVIDFVEIKKRR